MVIQKIKEIPGSLTSLDISEEAKKELVENLYMLAHLSFDLFEEHIKKKG